MADLWYFIRLLGRQRWWLLAGTLLMLVTALSSVGLLALSGWFVTAAGLTGLTVLAGGAMAMELLAPRAGIRVFALTRTLSRYSERLVNHSAVFRILADLRLWLFRGLLQGRRAQLARLRDGELLNRITADIDALDHLYLRVLGPSAVAGLGLLLALVAVGMLAPMLLWPLLLVLVPLAVLVPWWTQRSAARLAAGNAALASQLREQVIADARTQAELHLYGGIGQRLQTLTETDRERLDTERRLAQAQALAETLLSLGTLLTVALTLAIGLSAVSAGALGAPILVGVVLGMFALGELLAPLPLGWQLLGKVRWSATRLRGLRQGLSAVDRTAGALVTAATPVQPSPGSTPGLLLDGLWFRHRAGHPPCLADVSLRLGPGEALGVVGPSGTGKSSLLGLIMGELPPEQGRVLLDGIDVATLPEPQLQACFALLDQRTVLFSATIAENLRVADPTASDKTLRDLLVELGLGPLLESLPDGLDTWLAEAGNGLSGGQARRLALARTLLKPAPIVLLDEPLEGLDGDTEKQVLAAILTWTRGRSLLMIGHDPARFPPLDRLYRIERGQLQPQPPHTPRCP
jgi:ATP-binding cassette, subfamily C, bacterial CydC